MPGSLPEQKRLFDLLQRAAEELKAAQKAATAAQTELDRERAAHRKTREALDELETKVKGLEASGGQPAAAEYKVDSSATNVLPMHRGIPMKTVSMAKPPMDEKTAVQRVDAEQAEMRNRELSESLDQTVAKEKALRSELDDRNERESEMTGELGRLREQLANDAGRAGELEAKLVSQDVELSSLREQLIVEQARGGDMRQKLGVLEDRLAAASQGQETQAGERARSEAFEARVAELETLAGQAKTALEAEHARATLGAQRVAQLEGELAAIRVRRDELNVELAHVESSVKQARARVSELEGQLATANEAEAARREALVGEQLKALEAETAKRVEAEGEKVKERDRHQMTAQKLLETRARVRELEGAVDQAQARLKDLEAAAARRDEEHSRAIARHLEEQGRTGEEHRARMEDLQRQLEHATNEWRHVERQYEQLHREMLVLLDQRDEARRELDAIKQRFGLR